MQLLIELRLRQSSTAPVHAFIASMATLGKIACFYINFRCTANEIPDVDDLVALTCCSLTPQLVHL
jgi:hypothetical protein